MCFDGKSGPRHLNIPRRSDMSNQVSWMLELKVQSGREDDFKSLANEMIKDTQENEPGTLVYEWSTSEDGQVCHVYERYADSAAVMTHLAAFGEKFAGRFLSVLTPTRIVVYGAPSPEVKEALRDFSPVYMNDIGGFTR
jgi:quinol monooxygenase YgiN